MIMLLVGILLCILVFYGDILSNNDVNYVFDIDDFFFLLFDFRK